MNERTPKRSALSTWYRWFHRLSLLQAIVGAGLGVFGNALGRWLLPVVSPIFQAIQQYWGAVAVQAAAIIGTFVLGTLLYWYRCYSPRWYGTLEIAFGIAVAVYIVNQLLGTTTGSAALVFAEAAALYVIVRGYDNIYKSLLVEHRLKWNRFFFRQNTDQKL